jgi:hypothetical protein
MSLARAQKSRNSASLFGAGEVADGVGGAFDIREQVEPLVLVPGVAGEDVRRLEFQVLLQRGPGGGEQLLEDVSHGDHGRSRVHRATVHADLAHLAAGVVGALEQGDLETAAHQP